MDETTQCVAADQTQHVHNQKNHKECPKHFNRPPDQVFSTLIESPLIAGSLGYVQCPFQLARVVRPQSKRAKVPLVEQVGF